ncbi:MAG TPA: SDR family NAD(P)-dependent oxidoreductase [Pseudonocardiaceae bacterium]|jgi:NAD(P)-dependent dehydrogenase (short-subunit alcohol dehydrogenase family)|nr:SDR family NAD(P)-dependent oxidoreductase [Pseudonocardiaceae bacterium]
MQPIEKQTIMITGATSGLGRALVAQLAQAGATVIAHGRDAERLARIFAEIRDATGHEVDTVQADLADLAQVDRMADEVLDRYPQLHALVNNAGVGYGPPGGGREVSADGIELRFAVNHLAGYLLAQRLAGRLAASAPSRIVQVASAGQLALDLDDPFTEQDYDGVTAYRRSKLAQVMASYDLAADLAGTGVSVNAVHPATFMDTAMVHEAGQLPASTVEEGVAAVARLITDPELDGVSGRYFQGSHEAQPDPQAKDPAMRSWLRRLSDGLLERSRSGSR